MVELGAAPMATLALMYDAQPMRGVARATQPGPIKQSQALKLEPQPQDPFEFGLLNLNPAPCMPSM
jgi:hypothetical protein